MRNVLANAEAEYGIDPKPALIVGLGHGGSLVWQIACYVPNFADILAPVGGVFWRNIPKDCRSGANLIHTHQRGSAFWPLRGTKRSERRYARTSVYGNLDMLLAVNRCGTDSTVVEDEETGLRHISWTECSNGGPVEFMLLDEPFDFQTWWLDQMLARIALAGIEPAAETPEVPLETGPAFRKPGEGSGAGSSEAPGEPEKSGSRFKRPGSGAESRFKRVK